MRLDSHKLIDNILFLVVAIFSYLKPSGFDAYGYNNINTFFNILRIVCAVIIVMNCARMRYYPRYAVYYFLFVFARLLIGFVHGIELSGIFILGVSCFTFFLLVEYHCKKGSFDKIVTALYVNYFCILWVNLLLIIFTYGFEIGNLDDVYVHYSFISSDNSTAGYIFSALYVIALNIERNGKKIRFFDILLVICILLTTLRMWSATTLVGTFIYIIYFLLILADKGKVLNRINLNICLAVSVILNLGVSFFGIQRLFSGFIENVLHKSVTLTGRTTIWEYALQAFMRSPLIGVGKLERRYVVDNMCIHILAEGGIILLAIFTLFMCTSLKVVIKNEKNKTLTSAERVGYFMIIIIVIMSIAESWNKLMGLYIILALINGVERQSKIKIQKGELYSGKEKVY